MFVFLNSSPIITKKLKLFQAGICPGRLQLAYEPEVAALYCKQLTAGRTVEHGQLSQMFVIERPYVVVDLGG